MGSVKTRDGARPVGAHRHSPRRHLANYIIERGTPGGGGVITLITVEALFRDASIVLTRTGRAARRRSNSLEGTSNRSLTPPSIKRRNSRERRWIYSDFPQFAKLAINKFLLLLLLLVPLFLRRTRRILGTGSRFALVSPENHL